jgi:pyruvate kinase
MISKLTKIVATIGPATETEEQLTALINAGMNVARFNTKHSEPDWHNERIQRVRAVAEKMGAPISVLLDLQGPEVRINLPNGEQFDVTKDEHVTLTADANTTTAKSLIVPANVISALNIGNQILFEDGACEFEITEKNDVTLQAKALHACTVKHRKTLNTPGVVLDMPSLTERDFSYLDGIKPDLVDFVGLSFVRNKHDIEELRHAMQERGYTSHIVAKIENQNAVNNLQEICEAADAVMVARGDLGVEVPYQELTYWQKKIIQTCRILGKPVITATEMLKSMVDKPRPTRAEVSDVAHAIYDGTDAVMLSEETTMGTYPVKAVETQATIAAFNEVHADQSLELPCSDSTTQAITAAAMTLLETSNLPIDKIICLTETGRTANLVSRFRPHIPILAFTHEAATWRRLSMSYGVEPVLFNEAENNNELTEESFVESCIKKNILHSGEFVLLVRGKFWRKPGFTNTVSVIQVP